MTSVDGTGQFRRDGGWQGRGYRSSQLARWTGERQFYVPDDQDLLAESFVAMDFETANRAGVSACQIALVKVRGGEVVDTMTSLIRPPAGAHFEFTYLHGIADSDVAGAPTWVELHRQIADFVQGVPVWAHNARFDAGVWRNLDDFYGVSSLPERFYCSFRTARILVPGLVNYQLPTVVAECAPDFVLDHHHADSDALACAQIVCDLQSRRRALSF